MSGPADARSHVARDHAVIAAETHVPGPVPGWSGTQHVTLIAPGMGARFSMALVEMAAAARAGDPPAGASRAVYVLEGELRLRAGGPERAVGPGALAWVPSRVAHVLEAAAPTRAVVFDTPQVETTGPPAEVVVLDAASVGAEPMLGDAGLRVRTLLPEAPGIDLAVNLMEFDTGAALPRTEVHVMEHGLLVLEGRLVYRLGDCWHPVEAGDAVWMGSFCPQWCCAYGGPARYLIMKDWNRDPLA